MPDRYFSETPILGDRATLSGPEAHHLLHVMRARPGDRVVLFDGSGAEIEAEVRATSRTDLELTVLSRAHVDRELPVEVILGVALPKGDRQKWLVEKAVELGVTRLVPLRTARSVAQPEPKTLDRLRRAVIESSKQCGRNRLMEVAAPLAWPVWLASAPTAADRLVAHPGGDDFDPSALKLTAERRAGPYLLAIGPEGGFDEEEIALASSTGWRSVDLGARTMRTETAALVLVALAVGPTPKPQVQGRHYTRRER